ncbi:MAG: spermidine synthase [Streptosporangiaceae bacterium]
MAHRQHRGRRAVTRVVVDSGTAELVPDPDPGRPRAWTLLLNGAPQSHVDLDDPQYLAFDYMRRIADLIDLAAPAGDPLRVLHLGAGGLTLARYVAATRPGSAQLAVEADAALAELVRQRLPLSQPSRRGAGHRAGRIRVRTGDARAVLEQAPAGSADLVIADVFGAARTPAHLMSAEFTAVAGRTLRPQGIYAANIADGPPLADARARAAAVWSAFPHACLIADTAVLRGRRPGNLVLAAAHRSLPTAALARRLAGTALRTRLIHGAELVRFTAGARPAADAGLAAAPGGKRAAGPPRPGSETAAPQPPPD